MSAAAVLAVRLGLRMALPRARAPAAPARRARGRANDGGQRPHEARGDEGDAEEERQAAEHRARTASAPVLHAVGERGRARGPPTAATRVATAIAGATPARREGRTSRPRVPPRSAARAWRAAPARASRSSSSRCRPASETMTVRVAKTVAGLRQVELQRRHDRGQTLGEPDADEQPGERAEQADDGPSISTERSTCRRDAPSVRSVANSRARWATVIESVLKITNAPTNSAIPAKASRNVRMKLTNVVDVLGVVRGLRSAAVWTCAEAAAAAGPGATSARWRDARARRPTRCCRAGPACPSSCCAVGGRKDGDRGAAERVDRPEAWRCR